VTFTHRRRLAVCAIVAVVSSAGAYALAAPAQAAPAPRAAGTSTAAATGLTTFGGNDWIDQITRTEEVAFAQTHWSWTAWNDPTPVAQGADQPNYQCAEFVARAMAAAGLIPGLSPNSPQNDYFNYTAPNGKVYDLLLISDLPQYNNIYAYLMDSGIGIDVGDKPQLAQPGDFVVTYLGPSGTPSHMGLIDTAQTATAEPTVDAHNRARLQYGYHFYAPSHLVELAPDAYLKVLQWAASSAANKSGAARLPHRSAPIAPNHRPATVRPFADPAGPQV
jgi:hypothetical protein